MTGNATAPRGRLLFVVNEAFFFLSHRRAVAEAARRHGFEVHVAAPPDHVWAPAGFDVAEVEKAGFHFHPLPLARRGKNPLQDLRTLVSLLLLYRRLKPALVHLMTIKPVIYGGIAARIAGVPASVSLVTGLGQVFVAKGARAAILRRFVLATYRAAAGHPRSMFVFQNPDNRDVLVRAGSVALERTRVVRGSGVSLPDYAPVPEPVGAPLTILPARLIWEKGIGEFVAAARTLRARHPTWRFALVGDTKASNPRSVPEAQIRAWEAENVIEWWGRREDMPAVYAACAVVCLPSTYGEGVPKALIEAAAAARAIVTTDIAGCREIVHHEDNGLLVAPGDVDGLARALERVLLDAELRQRLGARGRAMCEEGFSEEEIARQMLAIYDEVLAPRP